MLALSLSIDPRMSMLHRACSACRWTHASGPLIQGSRWDELRLRHFKETLIFPMLNPVNCSSLSVSPLPPHPPYTRIMNGINAPKVVDCLGSDGRTYRQLAKSGNDDLRQDAVREGGRNGMFLQS